MNTVEDLLVDLCCRFEGFSSRPYLCPAGIPTIGIGSTYYENGRKVTLQDPPISKARAIEILKHTLVRVYIPQTLKYCPGLEGTRLVAIADFCYNLGGGCLKNSTLRKRINADDMEGAAIELRRWVRGGGRVLKGLVLRRNAEINLL